MNNFAFVRAKTIADAASAATLAADIMLAPDQSAKSDSATVVKAGGIDLLDLVNEGVLSPTTVVSLMEIPGLDAIAAQADGGLRVGAMVTLANLAAHPLMQDRYPALVEAVRDSASPQIRNVATIGGNLLQRPRCWYFRAAEFRCLRKGGGHCFAIYGESQYHAIFDNRVCAIVHPSTAATALVALGATVELSDNEGAGRYVLLEDFFVGPSEDVQRENDLRPREILTALLLPPSIGLRSAHLKLAQKASFDWPLADVAVVLELTREVTCTRAAIILGAAAPTPHRARAAEALLMGKTITESLAADAGRAALDSAAPLAKNAYKLPIFEALVRRAILQAAAPS